MSLTGVKREFELHSSDSECHDSTKRHKDESSKLSGDVERTDDEVQSLENPVTRASDDESSKSAGGSLFESEIEASRKVESDNEEQNSAETKDGEYISTNVEKTLESAVPVPKTSGFVFGSAAKTMMSFASVGTTEKQKPSLFAAENQTIEPDSEEANVSAKEVVTQNETGEEDEVTVVSGKAKLFQLDPESKEWKEKGVGLVKLNLCSSVNYSRIIMRSDGVPRVLINQRVFPELKFELLQGKNIRFSAIFEGSVQHLLLRFRDAQDAAEFTIHLEDHVELSKESN